MYDGKGVVVGSFTGLVTTTSDALGLYTKEILVSGVGTGGANVPQAWAAGSIFAFLQAILGLVPDAPRGLLHVDPALPDEIPELAAVDLRVGKRRFDLRFWREGRTTRWEVTSGDKEAVAQRSFADRKGA